MSSGLRFWYLSMIYLIIFEWYPIIWNCTELYNSKMVYKSVVQVQNPNSYQKPNPVGCPCQRMNFKYRWISSPCMLNSPALPFSAGSRDDPFRDFRVPSRLYYHWYWCCATYLVCIRMATVVRFLYCAFVRVRWESNLRFSLWQDSGLRSLELANWSIHPIFTLSSRIIRYHSEKNEWVRWQDTKP